MERKSPLKRILIISVCFVIAVSGPLMAQEESLLGRYHGSVGFDYVLMQHDTFAFDDAGIRLLMKGYGHLGDDWYLGGEASAGGNLSLFLAPSIGTVALEVNGKRAFGLTRHLILGLGAGVSWTNLEYIDSHWSLFSETPEERVEDWVLGAQVFADLTFRIEWATVGLSVKQTVTQDVDVVEQLDDIESDWDVSSLSIGVQAGFLIP